MQGAPHVMLYAQYSNEGQPGYVAPLSLAEGGTAADSSKLGGQPAAYYQAYQAASTGLGASLASYTYSGTYATDYPTIQALHNKVVAIEAILRARNIATT